ncbi:MAG: gliding motility protein GldC [Chitinophagaceae bacterium]|nr:gliding motility protein GldC [Chitinophagaceae bacterium]
MKSSNICIEVTTDENRIPQSIRWKASDTTAENWEDAKAMLVSFWDGKSKSALRIDLWTKEMLVDEMADFFYQTFFTMADTYSRATRNQELAEYIRNFAKEFLKKFKERDLRENKL